MTTIITQPTTRAVLAEMLVENTGASLLDSGGAYGRHHERNHGKSEADFEAQPQVYADKYGTTLSVYHYLARRLEYSPDLQAEFETFITSSPDNEGWLALAERFAETKDEFYQSAWNTYNGDCYLSQTVQGVTFRDDKRGETYALIQIHGGCDVRGGYTKPRVFRIVTDNAECFPYDHASFSVECLGDSEHNLTCDGGYFYNAEGISPEDSELPKWSDEHSENRCGTCGASLVYYAPEPY